MFSGCSKLLNFPEISNLNTSNVTVINNLFENCSSLSSLPNINN